MSDLVAFRRARALAWVSLLFALLAFGWALVTAADARHEAKPDNVRVVVVEVEAERVPEPTPFADSLVDFDALERETDCLWVILQEQFGWDITMERVTAAALWTHELGGACAVIGEDDE